MSSKTSSLTVLMMFFAEQKFLLKSTDWHLQPNRISVTYFGHLNDTVPRSKVYLPKAHSVKFCKALFKAAVETRTCSWLVCSLCFNLHYYVEVSEKVCEREWVATAELGQSSFLKTLYVFLTVCLSQAFSLSHPHTHTHSRGRVLNLSVTLTKVCLYLSLPPTSVTRKKSPNVYKVAQKWFH